MKVDGQFIKALKMSIRNKSKSGWTRETGRVFIAEEILEATRDEETGDITIVIEGYNHITHISEYNLPETEEILKWAEYQDGNLNTVARKIPYSRERTQMTFDLAEVRRVVEEANSISQALGFGAEDPETGLQLMEHWLPKPIKRLLIEEHKRPDGEKIRIAIVKYFNPYGTGTWYFSEYDPEYDKFFGLCKIHEAELGYASNSEMRDLRAPPFNLPLERNVWFKPKVLSEIREVEG